MEVVEHQVQLQNLVDLQQVVVEQVGVDLQDKDQVHLEVQGQPTLAVAVEYLVDQVVLEDPAEAAEKMLEVEQEIHHRLVHLKEIVADHQVTLLEQVVAEQVLLEVLLEVKMVVMVVQV